MFVNSLLIDSERCSRKIRSCTCMCPILHLFYLQIQNASNRPERVFIDSRQLRICATCFDLALALLRVLEMIVNISPQLFTDFSKPNAEPLLTRLLQVCISTSWATFAFCLSLFSLFSLVWYFFSINSYDYWSIAFCCVLYLKILVFLSRSPSLFFFIPFLHVHI